MSSIFKKRNKRIIISSIFVAIALVFYLCGRYDKEGNITEFGCKLHYNCNEKEEFNRKLSEERYFEMSRYCDNQNLNFRTESSIKSKNCTYYTLLKKMPKEYIFNKENNYRIISSQKESVVNDSKVLKQESGYENYKRYDNVNLYK